MALQHEVLSHPENKAPSAQGTLSTVFEKYDTVGTLNLFLLDSCGSLDNAFHALSHPWHDGHLTKFDFEDGLARLKYRGASEAVAFFEFPLTKQAFLERIVRSSETGGSEISTASGSLASDTNSDALSSSSSASVRVDAEEELGKLRVAFKANACLEAQLARERRLDLGHQSRMRSLEPHCIDMERAMAEEAAPRLAISQTGEQSAGSGSKQTPSLAQHAAAFSSGTKRLVRQRHNLGVPSRAYPGKSVVVGRHQTDRRSCSPIREEANEGAY